MSLIEKFDQAAAAITNLKTRPSDSDLLELYGLFKQSTVGDINTEKPGVTDIKGKAKWEAWNSKKGLSQEVAKQQYIAKATALGAL